MRGNQRVEFICNNYGENLTRVRNEDVLAKKQNFTLFYRLSFFIKIIFPN